MKQGIVAAWIIFVLIGIGPAMAQDKPLATMFVSPEKTIEIDEGGTGSLSVRFALQDPSDDYPSENTTVTLSSADADLSFSPNPITFGPLNFFNNQSVTIEVAHDADNEDFTDTVTLAVSGGLDADDKTITVKVDDDEPPTGTLVLSPSGTFAITEDETKDFTVKLSVMPEGNVTVSLSKTDNAITLSPTSLAFTESSWNIEQSVSVSVAHDDDSEDFTDTVTLAASGGITASDTTMTIDVEDDAPSGNIVILPAGTLEIDEGGSGSFTVEFDTRPEADISVSLSKTDDDISLSKSSLTFTRSDWNQAQSVTVSASQDQDTVDDDDTVTLSVSGGIKASDATKKVTVADDDAAFSGAVVFSPEGTLTIDEGESASVSIELSEAPTENVRVQIYGSFDIAIDGQGHNIFTPSNWNTPQSVTFQANHKAGTTYQTGVFAASVHNVRTGWLIKEQASSDLTLIITDKDASVPSGNIVLSPTTDFALDEGESKSFTVKLSAQPKTNVVVSLSSDDDAISLSLHTLTFTLLNWNRAQSIAVNAVQDGDSLDDSATITLSASAGITASNVTKRVSVEDDDSAFDGTVIVSPDEEHVVEEGEDSSVQIKLSKAPRENIEVLIYGSFAITLDQNARKTFTPTNWNTLQTVNFSANEEPHSVYQAGLFNASIYNVRTGKLIEEQQTSTRLIIEDSDAPTPSGAIVLSPTTALALDEGESGSFDVKLSAQPKEDVTVSLSSDDDASITLSPTSLTFTPLNWNKVQSVSVEATEDSDNADESATITLTASEEITAPDATKSVTVTDDDSAFSGTVVFSPEGDLTIDEGESGSISVKLSEAPKENVKVQVYSDLDIAATTSKTFTPSNWNTLQSVSIQANHKAGTTYQSGDLGATITNIRTGSLIKTQTSSNATLIITDSDSSAPTGTIVLSPATALTIDEGESESFTVKLSVQPNENVTVSLSSDNGDITLSPSSLAFTLSNWDGTQSVTVNAGEDDDSVDDTATLTLAASAGIAAPNATKAITVTDDDPAFSGTVIFSPDGDFTVEEGESASIEIKLSEAPKENVRVQAFGSFGILIDGRVLNIFTPSNWDTLQTVSFRALDDPYGSYQKSPFRYSVYNARTSKTIISQALSNMTLIIEDSDAPVPDGTIVLSSSDDLEIDESESASFTVKLSIQPKANVTVSLSSDTAGVSPSPDRLTFTLLNWKTAQSVSVTAEPDNDTVDETAVITLSASDGIDAPDVTIGANVTDDDQSSTPAGNIVLSPAGTLAITEGVSKVLGVRLSVMPQGNVIVRLSTTLDDLSLFPASLAFTSSSWNKVQRVSVRAAHDDDLEGFSDTITAFATGGINALETTKAVDVSDDDSPVGAIVLSSTATLALDEGDSASFGVRLSIKPNANVTVSLAKTRDDLSLSPTGLTFSPTNWNTMQTVTVRAAHDDDSLDSSDTITLSAAGGIDAPDVTKAVSVIDDDPPSGNIVLSSTAILAIDEGESASFDVKLGVLPKGKVSIALSKGNDDLLLSPSGLTFTEANWDREQRVTVSVGHDEDSADDTDIITLTASGGLVATATKSVNISDDDPPDGTIVLSPAGTLAIDEGGSVRLDIRIGTQPKGNVTIALSKTNDDLSLLPSSLVFTVSNWDRSQSVTVSAAHDEDAADDNDTVALRASGGLVATVTKTVSIIDDDPPNGAIILSPAGTLAIDEGGSEILAVRLGTRPKGSVTVALSKTNADLSLSPIRLNFTESDWARSQNVIVKAEHDDDALNDSDTITLVASGGLVARATKKVEIGDGDTLAPAIVLSPADTLVFGEGESERFSVRLGTRPQGVVLIALSKKNDDISLSLPHLAFTETNWHRWQQLTVSAIQDDDLSDDSDIIDLLASGDSIYRGLSASLPITVIDSPGELAISAETIDLIEGLPPRSFSLRLGVPLVDTDIVFVSLSNTDPDITLSPFSLLFTKNNWGEPQSVDIEAAEDPDHEDERDIITLIATGGNYRQATGSIMVAIRDNDNDGHGPPGVEIPDRIKAYLLAIPPDTAIDQSEMRIRCHQNAPCAVYLDCSAQSDGSIFKGWLPEAIPARGGRAIDAADIVRYTGGSWSGMGRLGCALRSEQSIGAQIWTYSGDGVLVNNSAMIRSVMEDGIHRADIDSIPSPDGPERSNIRLRCISSPEAHCTDTDLSCFDDEGRRYEGELGTIRRLTTMHLQSERLAEIIDHRWKEMGLSCEIRSSGPFTAQILTRTGGGGALVNNSGG
ncbi:MAG: hypothetical protein ISN28_03135 [Ectothiorhodospiraceae bacterium AqS1]|nr:hypothetical protein [Ectothiorhodospiraceae bacterium AqS1]